MSQKVFTVLAESEGKIHNMPVEKVHFHEVGAIDSIADIVVICHLIDVLKVDKIVCSPVATGTGFVETQHGTLPVPAPATYDLLRNIPVKPTGIESEMTTPTGAAVVKALADTFGEMPAMSVESTGYGAGTKTFEIPNVTRVSVGSAAEIKDESSSRQVFKLETNMDDCSPEQIAWLLESLFTINVLDAWTTPVVMKKGRLATMLSVLCHESDIQSVESFIFQNSTTLGIRRTPFLRTTLERTFKTVTIDGIAVTVKYAVQNGVKTRCKPEFESIKKLADAREISFNQAEAMIIEAVTD
jgi:uncharacterized protein (TIGR00299 family) protein